MHWLQRVKQSLPKHNYAIDARQLGDFTLLPWSNLGDWSVLENLNSKKTYPQACQSLAYRLAESLNLNSKDQLLDLGCGQGASLLFWQQYYGVKHIEGVELQAEHVEKIRRCLPNLTAIHHLNFLNLKQFEFKKFDVVMCIDAAYHVDLNSFLDSVNSVLNSKARLGFHTLIWSDEFLNSNFLRQQQYRLLLKAADVDAKQLMQQHQLIATIQNAGFATVDIVDLTTEVFAGFADYIDQQMYTGIKDLDRIKIEMTAKLCRTLFRQRMVKYVQVSAKK